MTDIKDSKKSAELETRPDGWKRFEGAVDIALKSPRKPKDNKVKSKPKGKTKG